MLPGDRHRPGIWMLAAGILLVAIALGYLAARNQRPAPAPAEKLRIAMPAAPHTALVLVAAAKGYFAEEGLQVTIVPAIHGKAAVDLVAKGEADLATASEVAFVLAAMKGEPLAIAANIFHSSGDLAVIARRDRGIAGPSDLGGKKVGVSLGTAGEYFLWAYFVRHKLAFEAATIVNFLPAEIPKELANGTIDAAATWQPNVIAAEAALGKGAATFRTGAYVETFNVIGHGDFLKAHRRTIEKLVRALLKAERHTGDHPEEALRLVAARLNIGIDDLRPVWKEFNFGVDLTQSQLITLEDVAAWAMARGYAERGPMPNFLPALYLDALLAVEPARVTVAR
jgi:ABC-type nitrate/sulfonate/bicarbonate transport system substrate-binding protein